MDVRRYGYWIKTFSFEDFINVFKKYEHCIKTVFFDDSINFVRRNGHWINRKSLDFFK